MFVGVKRFLTAVGINDVAMFVAVGVNADATAGANTDVAAGVNTDVAAGVNAVAAVVAAVAAGIVVAAVVLATAGVTALTAGVSNPALLIPVKLANVGTVAPVFKALDRVVAPELPPAPPNARSSCASSAVVSKPGPTLAAANSAANKPNADASAAVKPNPAASAAVKAVAPAPRLWMSPVFR